jgi:hypothetical protein
VYFIGFIFAVGALRCVHPHPHPSIATIGGSLNKILHPILKEVKYELSLSRKTGQGEYRDRVGETVRWLHRLPRSSWDEGLSASSDGRDRASCIVGTRDETRERKKIGNGDNSEQGIDARIYSNLHHQEWESGQFGDCIKGGRR